jgi:hypothetical protein
MDKESGDVRALDVRISVVRGGKCLYRSGEQINLSI